MMEGVGSIVLVLLASTIAVLGSIESQICLLNDAAFVMSWKITDVTTGTSSRSSGNYPVGQEACIKFSEVEGLDDTHAVVATVVAVLGDTIQFSLADVLYSNSSSNVEFSCHGTTLNYRCQLINSCDVAKGAGGDLQLRNFSSYHGVFSTWSKSIQSCQPVMTPTNDEELLSVLQYARASGYTVRPSGAGHSAGGIVTSEADLNAVVVSLAKYIPDDKSWDFSLDDACLHDPAKTCYAKIGAGYSFLDMYEQLRPKGLFPPTQTAGYFFQIGGVVANSVHGGVYNRSFVNRYVTALRVISGDGTIRIIDDEKELKYWRSSFGLLGIISAVQFRLERRENFVMYAINSTLTSWSAEEYWKFVLEEAEADLNPQANVTGGSRKAAMSDFFLNFYQKGPDGKPSGQMMAVNFKTGENAQSNVPPDPEIPGYTLAENYEAAQQKFPSMRMDGCPPDLDFINQALSGIPFDNSQMVASTLAATTYSPLLGAPSMVTSQRSTVNDGFFALEAPNTAIAAWFVRADQAFEAFTRMRDVVLLHFNDAKSTFRFNQPAEFRFVEIDADAVVLSPVTESGTYMISELLSFVDASGRGAWQRAYKEVEDAWLDLGAKPHLGKLMAFQVVPGDEESEPNVQPFQDQKTSDVFSLQRKCLFEAYRQSEDPDNLFLSGYAARFLQVCEGMQCVLRPLDLDTDCASPAVAEATRKSKAVQ